MFASKTAMQHVSKPNVLINARLQRLGRYCEGKPVLVWCYLLQELPNGIRVDGDGDWAPTTELLRRSTSGGAVSHFSGSTSTKTSINDAKVVLKLLRCSKVDWSAVEIWRKPLV